MENQTERKKLEALIRPLYNPLHIIFECGCGIAGVVITQLYWHWPTWLVMLVGIPVGFIVGFMLTALVIISVMLFRNRNNRSQSEV
ncbi:MAG: hypothetical protein ACRYFS_12115 [Janthinobacterium lividum]